MTNLEARAEQLLRRAAADRLPVDSGAVAQVTALIREAHEAGRQSLRDEQAALTAEALELALSRVHIAITGPEVRDPSPDAPQGSAQGLPLHPGTLAGMLLRDIAGQADGNG